MSQALTPTSPGQAGVSLARQLLLWVLLPQMVLWVAGGVGSYKFAAGYANQAVDDSLLQVTCDARV